MKNIKNIFLLTVLATLFFSCNSERSRQEQVSTVIANINSPFFIATLTPQNLIDKSGVENGTLSYTEQTLVSFFISAENTGIDNAEQMQIVVGKGSGMVPDVFTIFKIKNSNTFENLISKELGVEVLEKEGHKYFIYDNYYAIVWKDDFAVGCNLKTDLLGMFSSGNKKDTKTIFKCIRLIKAGKEGDIDTKYNDVLAKSNDISTYFDGEKAVKFLQGMKLMPAKELTKIKSKIDGVIHESALNFEKGKISFIQNFDLTDIIKEQLEFINDGGISSDLFEYGKSENPLIKYSFNVNSEKAYEFLKNELDSREFNQIEREFEKYGISSEKLAKSFTGQGLVMIDEVKQKTEMIDVGYGEAFKDLTTEPIIGIVLGIKDKSMFNEMSNKIALSDNGFMTLENNMFGCLTDDVFFVSNDSSWVFKVLNKTAVKIKEQSELTDNPYGFFGRADLEKNKTYYKGDSKVFELFTNFYGFANLEKAEVNLELKNKEDNALKTIVKFFSDMKNNFEEEMNIDMLEMIDSEVHEDVKEVIVEEGLNDLKTVIENAK